MVIWILPRWEDVDAFLDCCWCIVALVKDSINACKSVLKVCYLDRQSVLVVELTASCARLCDRQQLARHFGSRCGSKSLLSVIVDRQPFDVAILLDFFVLHTCLQHKQQESVEHQEVKQ